MRLAEKQIVVLRYNIDEGTFCYKTKTNFSRDVLFILIRFGTMLQFVTTVNGTAEVIVD